MAAVEPTQEGDARWKEACKPPPPPPPPALVLKGYRSGVAAHHHLPGSIRESIRRPAADTHTATLHSPSGVLMLANNDRSLKLGGNGAEVTLTLPGFYTRSAGGTAHRGGSRDVC